MPTRPGQRRTARLVVLLGGATALIAAAVAARWWIRWPERIGEQLATLVREAEFGKANRLLTGQAAWTRESNPALLKLHDGSGETLVLGPEEWKELFTGESFTVRPRTSADYLHARQVLEVHHRLPIRSTRIRTSNRRRVVVSRPPKRLVLTIERGAVSVRILEEPQVDVFFMFSHGQSF